MSARCARQLDRKLPLCISGKFSSHDEGDIHSKNTPKTTAIFDTDLRWTFPWWGQHGTNLRSITIGLVRILGKGWCGKIWKIWGASWDQKVNTEKVVEEGHVGDENPWWNQSGYGNGTDVKKPRDPWERLADERCTDRGCRSFWVVPALTLKSGREKCSPKRRPQWEEGREPRQDVVWECCLVWLAHAGY